MKSIFKLLVVTFFLLIQLNCGKKEDDALIIGAILPLTGNIANLGESAKIGLTLAESYINSLENNKKIKIIFEDGKGYPSNSINALTKLLYTDNAKIIFSMISAVDLSILPYQKREKFLMISHSSHPDLSNVDSLVFRYSNTVIQEVNLISNLIVNSKNISICYMNDDYGIAFNKEFYKKISAQTNINSVGFGKDESNFTTIISKILFNNPEKIVICAAGRNISDLVIKLRERNYRGEIITTLAYVASGANKNTENIGNLSMISFNEKEVNIKYRDFINKYEQMIQKKIGTTELIFFNSALIVYNASKHTNTPNLIAQEIHNENSFDVAYGRVEISEFNDILPELIIVNQK